MNQAMPVPMDVRLMNISASLLGIGVCVALLSTAAWWAVRHPYFSIARIVVQGDTVHNNEVTLRANLASRLQGNFFTLDLLQVRSTFESIPWVRKANVRREFPNQLRINLEEHQSAGLWGADSDSRLINSYGEVFEANTGDAEVDDLPRLIGPDGQSATVLEVYRSLSPLFVSLDAGIEQLELTGRGSWRMLLDSGALIELGRGTAAEIVLRVRKFISTYTQVSSAYQRTGLEPVELVDLRHNQGYAIRLRGVTTVVANTTPEKK